MQIQLKTLSPVHIGSGNQITPNAEYLYFSEHKELAIIDDRKILEIIGEEEIPTWLDYIEKCEQSFVDYLLRRSPDLKPIQVAKRLVKYKGMRRIGTNNPLREQIHTGMGGAYFPGSSIKGAFRTALLGNKMMESEEKLQEKKVLNKNRRGSLFKDREIVQNIFGSNPNKDWFRVLQVSDFHFNGSTEANFVETLNEDRNENLFIKHKVKQLSELVPKGIIAKGKIRVNRDLQKAAAKKTRSNDPVFQTPKAYEITLKKLFQEVNKHSVRLIGNEISLYENLDFPQELDGFVDNLLEIEKIMLQSPGNSCVLRLGFGTGYRNMTGDWTEDRLDKNLRIRLSDSIRGKRYSDYPMPKTRKIVSGGQPLGYVQLTIME